MMSNMISHDLCERVEHRRAEERHGVTEDASYQKGAQMSRCSSA